MKRRELYLIYIAAAAAVCAGALSVLGLCIPAAVAAAAGSAALVPAMRDARRGAALAEDNDRLRIRTGELEAELKYTKYYLRERYMKGLIQGEVPPPDRLEPFLERYELNFPSSDFLVAAIMDEDVSGFFGDEHDGQPDLPGLLRLQRKIIEVFSRELAELTDFNLVSVDGSLAAILSLKTPLSQSGDGAEEERSITLAVESCLEAAVKALLSDCGAVFRVAVSSPFHSIYALNKAYMQVLGLAEADFGDHSVLSLYTNASEDAAGRAGSIRRIDSERQFYNLIVSQEFEKAGETLLERLHEDREDSMVPFFRMKNDLVRRLDFMTSAAGLSWHAPMTESRALIREYLEIGESADPEELEERTRRFCAGFQRYWDACTQSSGGRAGQISDYIRENYADPTLNATVICDHFGISQAYLSRTFKQATGMGVLECIHKVRVEEAKRLLATDMTINDIAERVGYYSRRTLTQAFKRCEGVTPDMWRKNLVS